MNFAFFDDGLVVCEVRHFDLVTCRVEKCSGYLLHNKLPEGTLCFLRPFCKTWMLLVNMYHSVMIGSGLTLNTSNSKGLQEVENLLGCELESIVAEFENLRRNEECSRTGGIVVHLDRHNEPALTGSLSVPCSLTISHKVSDIAVNGGGDTTHRTRNALERCVDIR